MVFGQEALAGPPGSPLQVIQVVYVVDVFSDSFAQTAHVIEKGGGIATLQGSADNGMAQSKHGQAGEDIIQYFDLESSPGLLSHDADPAIPQVVLDGFDNTGETDTGPLTLEFAAKPRVHPPDDHQLDPTARKSLITSAQKGPEVGLLERPDESAQETNAGRSCFGHRSHRKPVAEIGR
jgi:hypothetical protein